MRLSANLALGALLALTIARLWLMPLPSSLWMDETITAFLVQYGPAHPSLAALPTLSLFYTVLPRLFVALFGFSEIALRLPSVLAMAVALFLLARLAARLIHPQAAWIAAFVCLTLRGFNFQATDARPYALGMAVMAAAVWFLVRWLDGSRWWDEALFVLFAALLWRVLVVYWPFYLVFAGYVVARLAWKETNVTWWAAGGVFAVLALALVPVFFDALALRADVRVHVFSFLPSPRALLYALELRQLIPCLAGAWLLGLLVRKSADAPRLSRASMLLIVLWWITSPLSLFVFSHVTGVAIFIERFYSFTFPGAALVATALIVRLTPIVLWRPLAAALGVGALVLLGRWGTVMPVHGNSGWRGAARTISQTLPQATPVICVSPFVEGKSPAWRPDLALPAALYSPLAVYPIRQPAYPFPYQTSPEAERYAATLSRTVLATSGRFVLYGYQGSVPYWEQWFSAREWTSRRLGPFGDVMVVEFAKR